MAEINTGGGENFKAPLTPNERAEKAKSDPNQKTLDGNSGQKTFGADYLVELKSNALKNEFITKFRSEQGKDTNTPGNPESKIEATPPGNTFSSTDVEAPNLADVPNKDDIQQMLQRERENDKKVEPMDDPTRERILKSIKEKGIDLTQEQLKIVLEEAGKENKKKDEVAQSTKPSEQLQQEPAPVGNSEGVNQPSADIVKNEPGVKVGDNPIGVKPDAAPAGGSNEISPEGKPAGTTGTPDAKTEAAPENKPAGSIPGSDNVSNEQQPGMEAGKQEPAPGETPKDAKDEKTDPNGGNTETTTGSGPNEKKQDEKPADGTKMQEGVKKDEAGKEVSSGWKEKLKGKLKDFVSFFDPKGKDREWVVGAVIGLSASGGATLTGGTIPLNIITTAAAGGILYGGEKLIYSLKERKIKKLEKTNSDEYAEKMKQLEDGHAKGVMRIQKFMKGLAAGAVVGGFGGIVLDSTRDVALVGGMRAWDLIKAPQHGFEALRSGVDQLGQSIKEGLAQAPNNIDNINYSIGETGKEITRTIMEKSDLANVEMKRIWETVIGASTVLGGYKVLEGLAKKIRSRKQVPAEAPATSGGEVKT